MKVAQLRKILAAAAAVYDRGRQAEQAEALRRLASVIKSADKDAVDVLVEKLKR